MTYFRYVNKKQLKLKIMQNLIRADRFKMKIKKLTCYIFYLYLFLDSCFKLFYWKDEMDNEAAYFLIHEVLLSSSDSSSSDDEHDIRGVMGKIYFFYTEVFY